MRGEHMSAVADQAKPLLKMPDAALESARLMLDRARWAAADLAKMDRPTIMRIVEAVADAAFAKAGHYAEWAVKETSFGVAAHKKIKNEACSRGLVEHYRGMDFVSPRINATSKIVELPRPAGVIFALAPVTNPVATVYFKTILALMTRNAIVLSPHPGAKACSFDAVKTLADAAREAGAPDGAIQALSEPTIPLIETIMTDDRVDLVVATGGPAVVKAAYRSGHPAIGVGSGNAPVFVDETADLRLAAQRIVNSKAFDNSILCTNESTILATTSIASEFRAQLKAAGAHICSPEETEKLRAYLFGSDGFNVGAIGKDASLIAERAGFRATGAKVLVASVTLVQPEEKLVGEKLCPVVAFAEVGGIDQAISCARSMMRKSGRGHSAAVHSKSVKSIMAFAASLPALRIVVNAGCSEGASGLHTNLGPSMTIGTGFVGGSSVGDNLAPHHLVNFARIAYNSDASEPFGEFDGLDPYARSVALTTPSPTSQPIPGVAGSNLEELRRIIFDEIRLALGR